MRYFVIRYLGFEYRHREPMRTILTQGVIFLSYAAAEAALPPVPYPADRETYQFPNYFIGDETVYEKRAWYIQELSERDIISMALSQGIYSYPNWPLRAPDDIAPIWRDPETPEAVSWWDGRRVQSMKPGRFLNRFYKDLTKVQIEYYARWWIDRQRPPREISSTVTFARTEEEMISAYARGPDSCMLGKKAPRAYAGGDFALATLEASSGEVSARVLVNEKTKTFGRIYSDEDEGEDLEELLRQMDYVSLEENTEGFEGARFLKIESSKNEYGDSAEDDRHMSFVMPYLDRNVYIDPLTWTATRNYQREFTLSSDGTSGVMTISKDTCAICGKLAMIQTYRHRVTHEDFGEGTALCPEHRLSESFVDSYNRQRYWGTPTYTDPDGSIYSKDTLRETLYASSTGAWYLEFQDPRISIDGKVYSTSEVTALDARFSERYMIWTFKSDEELRETHEPLYIQRKVRQAISDATYDGSWYSNISNRFEYGHRSSAFGDAEVQEASGLHHGGNIRRTVPSVSIFNVQLSEGVVSRRYQAGG